MNKFKFILALVVIAIVGYYVFEEKIDAFEFPSKEDVEQKLLPTVEVRERIEDGQLKADAEFIGGKRNGIANNYYANGSVHSSLQYKNDIKQGEATWFYRNGKPYRVTSFVDGKKDGVQKKYYENGTLMAEIPFEKGLLQAGTKEYWETGTLKTKYPELVIDRNNRKRLLVSLQPHLKKAQYYAIVSDADKTVKVTGVELKREVEIDLSDFSGKATVYVIYKTKMGNKKLIKKSVQL